MEEIGPSAKWNKFCSWTAIKNMLPIRLSRSDGFYQNGAHCIKTGSDKWRFLRVALAVALLGGFSIGCAIGALEPPSEFTVARDVDNHNVRFGTVVGQTYTVEKSTTLAPGSWTEILSNVAGTGAVQTCTDAGAGNLPKCFYRIRYSVTPTTDIATGLLASYNFSGNLQDTSGNNNHLINPVNLTYGADRFGNANQALVFNASNSTAQSTLPTGITGNSTRTVSVWIKAGAGGVQANSYVLGYGTNTTAAINGLLFQTWGGNDQFQMWGSNLATTATAPLSFWSRNAWHHVCYVYSGSVLQSKFFIDGNAVASSVAGTGDAWNTANTTLIIGNFASAGFNAFQGMLIDDIRIYNRAISGADVQQLFLAGVTRIIGLSGNLTFGILTVNTTATATMTISNTGNTPLTVSGITYPSGFSGDWSGGTILAGGNQLVTVTFSPTALQTYSGTVTVASDMTSGTNTAIISGKRVAVTRIIGVSGSLAFGTVAVSSTATATLTISNTGNTPLTVSGITYPSGFSGDWSGGTILAGGNQLLTVTFSPTALQAYSGTVTVASDMTSGTNTAIISGTGIPVPAPDIATGLLASYIFSGNLQDTSGNNNHLINPVNLSYVTDRFGNANQALVFNGSNSTAQSTLPIGITGNSSRTVSVWIKAGAGGGSNVNSSVLGYGANTTAAINGLLFKTWAGNDQFQMLGSNLDITTTIPLSFWSRYAWHHVCFVYSGSALQSKFFIDGNAVASSVAGTGDAWNTANTTLTIGNFASAGFNAFQGMLIDDIRIYNRALSGADVQQLFFATAARIIGVNGSLAFGTVAVSSTATATLTITNTGITPLTVTGITYPSGFSGAWSGTIPAGGSQNVTVTFSPTAAQSYGGTMTVASDMTGGTNTATISGAGIPATAPDIAIGLLASYTFSSNLQDTSGNNNHLINSVNLTYGTDRFGNANQALVFNGSNSTAQSTLPIGITGNSSRTVSVWIQVGTGGVQANSYVLGYGANTTAAINGLLFQSGGGDDQFQMWGSNLSTTTTLPLSFWSRNAWHHVCYVYSGSVLQSRFFIDGNAVASSVAGTGVAWNTANTPLTIGNFASAGIDAFQGMLIDDIRIYNRAMSGADVQQLFFATAARIIGVNGSLAFGNVPVSSTATATLTISNIGGNGPLTVTGITYPNGFSGDWGGGTIAAGGSQNVTVTFSPTAAQSYSGNVTVASDMTNGTNTAIISGTGVAATRIIGVSGSLAFGSLAFGNVAASTTEAATLTITNTGNTPLTVSGITYPNGFSGDWSGTIPAGGNQFVTVTFSPTALQAYSGNVTVASDMTSGTNTASISGTGIPAPAPDIATGLLASYSFTGNLQDTSGNNNHLINPVNLTYGADRFGNANQALVFNGSNSKAQSTLPIGIIGNSSRTVSVWIKAWGGGAPTYVLGYGTNTTAAINGLLFQTAWGNDIFQMWGSNLDTTTSAPLSFWSRNAWHHVCFVYSGSVLQSKFFIDGNAVASAKTGTGDAWNTANTILTIGKYASAGFNAFQGMLIDDIRIYNRALSVSDVQQLVLLTAPRIIGVSGNLAFGNVPVSNTEAATLTITNTGNTPLTVTGITYPSGFTGAWSGTIPAGGSQNVTVTFSPTALQTYSGTVVVASDMTDGTNTATISGTGIPAPAPDIATGLLASYNFSGNLQDTSGNNNHLINPVNLTYGADRFGNANQALVFNASNSTAQSTLPTGITGNSTRTVSVWIKAGAGGVQANSYVLGYGTNTTAAINGLLLQSWGGDDLFQMWGSNLDITTTIPLSFWSRNAWHHVCFVYSGSVLQPKFFIDGNAVASAKTGTGDAWNTANTTLTIGDFACAGFNACQGMLIDDVRIYNRALSVAEVQQLFFATAARIIGVSGSLAFGNVPVSTAATATLTISNTGNRPLTVSGITYPNGFSGDWNGGTIAAGGSQNVTVTFNPTAAQAYSGTVTVASDMTNGTNTAIISGTGTTTPTPGKQDQTISGFGPFPHVDWWNTFSTSFYEPSASSGLPVTIRVVSGPAALTVFSNYTPAIDYLSFDGTGTVVLEATQAGNSQFNPVTVTASIIVEYGTWPTPTPVDLALIPAGSFQMGDSLDGDGLALPVHSVNVSAFYMEKNLVTKALWDEVRAWGLENGYTDLDVGMGKATNHPVVNISWYSAVKWCNARSEKEGLVPCYKISGGVYKITEYPWVTCDMSASGYRLPTEAEWEKAARGGLIGKRFPWGDTISRSQANYSGDPIYNDGIFPCTSPVGSFAANGYGLYDMAGNVFQMCWDWYGPYGSGAASDPTGASVPQGPKGPTDSSSFWWGITRGGNWGNGEACCRVSYRLRIFHGPTMGNPPSSTNSASGFRCVRR